MFHICCQSRLRRYDNLILVGEQKYRTVVTKKNNRSERQAQAFY